MTALRSILRDRGWGVAKLAREMGMERTSVERTLKGRQRITYEFETALLAVCPRHCYSDLIMDTTPQAADDSEAVA